MLVKKLDQLCKIGQRSSEAIDLVDHNDVDLAGPDLGQEELQGRAVKRGARECPVVIMVGDLAPALMRLTLDVGLAGFALGVQRVELQVKVMVGGFPGVDRAAEELLGGLIHGKAPCD